MKGVGPRLRFFSDNCGKAMENRMARKTDKFEEYVAHEPLGTIANISAWNYAYFVGCNVFLPALLTGNSVLYKPSEHSTLTGLNITKLLHKAGVPEDVFTPIIGDGIIGDNLLDHELQGVFFTGSNNTGLKIANKASKKLMRTQLELGGKDPTYVTNDVVDVVNVAKSLADGAMYNTGQSCCSDERIYVHSSIYDKFVDTFVNEVKSFVIGDPNDDKTYIGPLALSTQPEFLKDQVDNAVKLGGKVLTGGNIINKPGNWFEPTVIVNVNHKMDVMRFESFGPIIGIQKVESDEEAIELMNDTHYGLTSGVYSNNKERAIKILNKIKSGTVYWNACDRVSPFVPWSARNYSGIGSTLGTEGISPFLFTKSYHLINP